VVEDREEMLADPLEIQEAEEEGVVVHNHLMPGRILPRGQGAGGVETLDVVRTFDDQGRFSPELMPGSERVWECDGVIIAIGQTGDLGWVQPEDGLRATPRGTLEVSERTLMSSVPGVFAGGDIAFGPRLIINAVADGQRAALGIHAYLNDFSTHLVRRGFFTPVNRSAYKEEGPLPEYLRESRREPATLPVERRVGVARVEAGYTHESAQTQAQRCLVCSLNPVFDGDLCILCNGCVDVCPMDCLKLVPVAEVAGDRAVAELVSVRLHGGATGAVMLLDSERCIRCGLCAERCPTGAVLMESFRFTEKMEFGSQDTQDTEEAIAL